jgi:hypothetical protein
MLRLTSRSLRHLGDGHHQSVQLVGRPGRQVEDDPPGRRELPGPERGGGSPLDGPGPSFAMSAQPVAGLRPQAGAPHDCPCAPQLAGLGVRVGCPTYPAMGGGPQLQAPRPPWPGRLDNAPLTRTMRPPAATKDPVNTPTIPLHLVLLRSVSASSVPTSQRHPAA